MSLNKKVTGIIFFVCLFIFCSKSFAQDAATIQLATQLCEKMGIVREIQKNIQETHARQIKRGEKIAGEKQKLNVVRQRFNFNFEKQKSAIEAAAVNKVALRFSQLFSAAELKYLVDSMKFPVMKKMYDYLLQSSYLEDVEVSSLEVAKLYQISRDQVLNPGK